MRDISRVECIAARVVSCLFPCDTKSDDEVELQCSCAKLAWPCCEQNLDASKSIASRLLQMTVANRAYLGFSNCHRIAFRNTDS